MVHPHAPRTLAWAMVFGIALTGDGIVVGSSRLVLVGAAIALPVIGLYRLVRRSRRRRQGAVAHVTSRSRPVPASRPAGRSAEAGGVEVYRWENEGGARQPA